jgi:ribosomal-protein-alanine N-acetyltransferase
MSELVSPVEILPATWRDVRPLYRLEKRCFPIDFWPVWDIFFALVLPYTVCLKAVRGEEIVGFVIAERRSLTNEDWIASIAVDADYRQCGIGSKLLNECEAQLTAERIRLSVRETNVSAIRLYKRLGYVPARKWRKYYKDGQDALIMEKKRENANIPRKWLV